MPLSIFISHKGHAYLWYVYFTKQFEGQYSGQIVMCSLKVHAHVLMHGNQKNMRHSFIPGQKM